MKTVVLNVKENIYDEFLTLLEQLPKGSIKFMNEKLDIQSGDSTEDSSMDEAVKGKVLHSISEALKGIETLNDKVNDIQVCTRKAKTKERLKKSKKKASAKKGKKVKKK